LLLTLIELRWRSVILGAIWNNQHSRVAYPDVANQFVAELAGDGELAPERRRSWDQGFDDDFRRLLGCHLRGVDVNVGGFGSLVG
jgi:hypothetical protein